MLVKVVVAVIALLGLTAWRDADPEWPASGAMPDEPGHASRYSYESIGAGTRSYRPVEPMPWGDVNRRVAPQAVPAPVSPATPAAPATQNAPASVPPTPMEHDHH